MQTIQFLVLLAAVAVGLHYLAKFLERSDRGHRRAQRLAAIRKRNLERDELLILGQASRALERNQPEAVDALVIRHLRPGRG